MAEMTWGGMSLPLPDKDGITITREPISVARRMLSGTLQVDYVTRKAVITVRWRGLNAQEYQQLMQAYDANMAAPAQLVLPDGQTFSQVVAVADPLNERHLYDARDQAFYEVRIVFEEV